MRIAFSVLVGLIICAAGAAGIYYYPVAQSPAVSATPQTEQTVVNPAASQAEQKTDAAPATEQPVTSPIPPAALPPRVVKTETIAPLPDGAAGTMAQQGRITAAKAHVKVKKQRKHVTRSQKRPPKTTPVVR